MRRITDSLNKGKETKIKFSKIKNKKSSLSPYPQELIKGKKKTCEKKKWKKLERIIKDKNREREIFK